MQLRKVLLVDDEFLVIKALKATIDWKSLECVVSGEAYDGEEALKLAQKMHVDIIITDINMPKLSGLNLIRQLHEENHAAKIIIMSGYDKFEYAQEAIRYGVSDYLLKPLTDEKIVDAILKAKNAIEYAQRAQESSFIKNCILGIPIEKESLKNIYLNENAYFRIVVLQSIDVVDANESDWKWIQNEFRSIMQKRYIQCYIEFIEAQLIVLMLCENKASLLSTDEIATIAQHMMQKIQNDTVVAGIGAVYDDFSCLPQSYHALLEQVDLIRMKQSGMCIIKEETCKETDVASSNQLQSCYTAYRDALLVRDAEGIPPAIDQIADCLINRNYQTVSVYKDTMIHVVVQLRNIMQTVFCNESTEMFLRNLLNTQNILPIEDFSREVQMQSLKQIQILHAVTAGEYSETVQAAVAYIEYHYQEDLGLDELAQILKISAPYLSAVFGKEVGEGPSSYINRCRITQAKRLLKGTKCKITEVAEKVGFHSDKHFIKTFKRYEQITPSQYRENANV